MRVRGRHPHRLQTLFTPSAVKFAIDRQVDAANVSGGVTGINYALLFSGGASPSETIASMIGTIYSSPSAQSGPSTFASTGNPLVDLKLAQKNEAHDVAIQAKQPLVTQAIAAFKTAVAKATTIQGALGNPNVQKVLLTANGLSKYIGDTTLVQKALLSDPHDPKSLARKMGDYALMNTVLTYNFAANGLKQLQDPKTVATLTSSYAEMMWRQSLEQATPGLSNALTFLEQASSIKSTNDILDNMVNFQVVTTALGIPQSIVNQGQPAQQQAIKSRLNIADLQNPNFVTSLTDQYLLTMQEQKAASSGTGGSLDGLAVKGLVV
jgi:hypothetical protein